MTFSTSNIRFFARIMLFVMCWEVFSPLTGKALTSGPTQPEVQQFQPYGTSGMVDLFTGNFNYNIPLFELPGPNGSYPFNLSYQSGITMDQEASWVGLGWNLNPGVITRQMRGIPDEFNGDIVQVEQDAKTDQTVGVNFGPHTELFGLDLSNASNLVQPSLTIYHNNYRGFGYSLDANFRFGSQVGSLPLNVGVTGNLKLDSQEGVGFSPKLSLGMNVKSRIADFNLGSTLGATYTSRQGLTDLTFGMGGRMARPSSVYHGQMSAPIGFAKRAFIPTLDLARQSFSINGTFRYGGSLFGLHVNATLGGFFASEKVVAKQRAVPAYGYQNLERADQNSMLDCNRSGDGMLHVEAPHLAIPQLTNDLYAIAGQGTGGTFRAWRNDVPILHDRRVVSEGGAASFGAEPSAAHAGVNLGINHSRSVSSLWSEDNHVNDGAFSYGAHDKTGYAADYEPWYFKLIGEHVADPLNDLDYVKSDEAVRIALDRTHSGANRVNFPASVRLELVHGANSGLTTRESYGTDSSRRSRNGVVLPVTNAQLGVNSPALSHYQIDHYNTFSTDFRPTPSQLQALDRNAPDHHFAGMSVHQADGMQYVYALPAYNLKHVETTFSVDGSGVECVPFVDVADTDGRPDYHAPRTDEFHHRTELPQYAHSYLLTSVLGQDYVDADTIPGPSDGDFGFWVKFNYVKVDSLMRWRAPFFGANFEKGQRSDIADDRGSYMYGEREQWYLASAETKTHLSEFYLHKRKDGKGVRQEFQNDQDANLSNNHADIQSGSSYRLDSIKLYSKIERLLQNGSLNQNAAPIRTVHFRYNYDLCPNNWGNEDYDPNAVTPVPGTGKLTLEKLWFTGEQSSRGSLSPFEFGYVADSVAHNPPYDPLAQDRWGTYKPYTNACEQLRYPYTDNRSSRPALDLQASAWNLKEIVLPTDGKLSIEYEADDYGYVQNHKAMRMFPLTAMGDLSNPDEVYPDSGYDPNDPDQRKVHFALDSPLNSSAELAAYFEGVDKLYLKTMINLQTSLDATEEIVGAYYDIESYGLEGNLPSNLAYVILKPSSENNGKWADFHPVALAARNHLRTHLSRFITAAPSALQGPIGSSNSEKSRRWKTLTSLAPEIIKIFKGYYDYAEGRDWGRIFDPSNSWIRLTDPNGTKIGGGCRVKMISLDDRYADVPNTRSYSNVVGTVYTYADSANGQVFSTGVAAYEPILGGDEIPLRIGKAFPGSTLLKSPNNLYFEGPVNEDYYPAPVIGYSKVTVKSLATERVITGELAASVPTTGAAVHEFYTARDFPVLTWETDPQKRPFVSNIPIPFIGNISYNDLTASQGYSIVLNDMHGKQKRVSNYGQYKNGQINPNAISWVEYEYQHITRAKGGPDEFKELRNVVNAMQSDVDPDDYSKSEFELAICGQDHEYFVDMREHNTKSWAGGLDFNIDFLPFLPIFVPTPTYRESHSRTRTAVTNKIITRSGILSGMRAWNEGSLVKTDHLLYDAQTGRPLLSRVTNNYDEPVYSYQYPAFWAYDRMGPAYKNVGLEFTGNLTALSNDLYVGNSLSIAARQDELLIPGDEFTVTYTPNAPPEKAIYVGNDANEKPLFFCETNIAATGCTFYNVRSGRHNLLGVNATEITALKNPTTNRDTMPCWRDITQPNTIIDSMWVVTDTVIDTVPAPCMTNFIGLLNAFFASGSNSISVGASPYNQYIPLCISCAEQLTAQGDDLIFECPNNSCIYRIGVNGQSGPAVVDPDSIASLQNLQYAANAGYTIGGSYVYSGFSVEVVPPNQGAPYTAHIFQISNNGCELPYHVTTNVVNNYLSTLTVTPNKYVLSDTLFMLDSVLSATATTFSDAWMQDFTDVRYEIGDAAIQLARLDSLHPFANGERGIWRAKGSYVYVTDRDQSTELNTRKDGTFSGLPMFHFQSMIFESCARKWRHVNEVTRYSPYSFELENRDVLDVYSAALYGYKGKLPVAVAANADYREIGFEDFENYAAGDSVNSLELAGGNLDFFNDGSQQPSPVLTPSDVLYGELSSTFLENSITATLLNQAKVEGRGHGSQFDPAVNLGEGFSNVPVSAGVKLTLGATPYQHLKPNANPWKGRVHYERPVLTTPSLINNSVAFTADKSHTGRNALTWSGLQEYPQNRLKLKAGKTYSLQAWVSRDDENVPKFNTTVLNPDDRLGIKVHFFDDSGTLIGQSDVFEPGGYIVEGWQKIEGEFDVPNGTENISLRLQAGVLADQSTPAAYLDDIRIQPLKSSMTCYVYDTDYRLKATLDDDNYALVYHYDEAGNLFLVQKETLDGLRTIQESRGFMVERKSN